MCSIQEKKTLTININSKCSYGFRKKQEKYSARPNFIQTDQYVISIGTFAS